MLWIACFVPLANADQPSSEIRWNVDFKELQESLKRREGIVIIDTDVARPVAAWRLDSQSKTESSTATGVRSRTIQPGMGRNVTAIILRSGRYHWQELSIPHFDLPYLQSLRKKPAFGFQVEPKTITYFGTLFVGEKRGSNSVNVRLLNRSAELALSMQEQDITLPEGLPWRFGGQWQDRFTEQFLPLQINGQR